MNKPFKTYRQQIVILRKRNLTVDGSKAMRALSTAGYYNIINGYKDIFLDTKASKSIGDDYYKSGTTFEQIYSLYLFDSNMRNILMKNLLSVETTVKTKTAYYFSEAYRGEFAYLNINNFDDSHARAVTTLISKLSNVINNNTSNNSSNGQINHYINNHKNVPLWVLSQKMTFGEIKHFIYCMKKDLKEKFCNDIIHDYNRAYKYHIHISPAVVSDIMLMLDLLNEFRNVCAHGERLYNFVFKKGKNIPGITSHFYSPQNIRFASKLFDCILISALFTSKKEYNILLKRISREIESLKKLLAPNQFNVVLMNMGFPKDWDKKLKL